MLFCNPFEIIIQGITSSGKPFRPSDWAERLSGILSSFGYDQRMQYSPYVRPLTVDDVKCVAVDRKLMEIDPRVYNFLLAFAQDNDLRVIDCKTLVEEQENKKSA